MNGERILLLLLLVIMPNSAENKHLAQGGTEELDIRKEGQGLRSVLVHWYKYIRDPTIALYSRCNFDSYLSDCCIAPPP